MYILQFSPPRVNVQTTYRFQSFLSQYVSLLDTKSPGEGRTPSVKPCGFATSPERGRFIASDRKAKGSLFEGRFPPAGGKCRAATKGGIWHAAGNWGSLP